LLFSLSNFAAFGYFLVDKCSHVVIGPVVITAQWSVHDVVDAVLLLQQDVLENDQIKLDSMFKFSLIQDIVRVTVALCCGFCSACRCDGLQNRGCRIQGLKLWSVSQSAKPSWSLELFVLRCQTHGQKCLSQ